MVDQMTIESPSGDDSRPRLPQPCRTYWRAETFAISVCDGSPGYLQGVRKPWKCRLGRHDYVRDRPDRPRGGPPPTAETCRRCGKQRDRDNLKLGPFPPGPWTWVPQLCVRLVSEK